MIDISMQGALMIHSMFYFVGLIMVLFMGYSYRGKVFGMKCFALFFAMNSLGVFGIYFRESLPIFISIIVANFVLLLGAIFLYMGVVQFYNRKMPYLKILSLSFIYITSFLIFTYAYKSVSWRIVVYGLSVMWMFLKVLLILQQENKNEKVKVGMFDFIIILFLGVHIFRIGMLLTSANPISFLDYTKDSYNIIVMAILGSFLSAGILSIVNSKLVKEISENDNILRNLIHQIPIPLMVHCEDGTVLRLSEEWTNKSGYSLSDLSTIEEWTSKAYGIKKEEVNEVIKSLYNLDKGSHDGEFIVTTKDGSNQVWDFYSGYIGSTVENKKMAVSVALDVTLDKELKKDREQLLSKLRTTQTLLKASLESPKDMIILSINDKYEYNYFNENHKTTMKAIYGKDIALGLNILDQITIDADRKLAKSNYSIALSGVAHSVIQQFGEHGDIYFESHFYPIFDDEQKVIGASVFARDISQRVNDQNELKESEERFRLLYSSMSQGLALHEFIFDEDKRPVTYKYLEINESYSKLFNVKKEDVIGKKIHEVAPDIEQYWIDTYAEVALTGEPKYYENYSVSANKHFATYSYSPKPGQFAVLISDITERLKRDEEITFLSYNDQLTEVYNRRYYEEQIIEMDKEENLPLSLIMGDVNGLKLVNDSFGHLIGDSLLKKVAKILQKACRNDDIITRIGGDEFVVILPKTPKHIAEKIIMRMNDLCAEEKVESIDISISFGSGTKTVNSENLDELFKEIEDEMYRKKLNESTSMRSKTIDLIITTLYEKNDREMSHSKRVSYLCATLAKQMKLDVDAVKQIETAGLMHDIGKIGIEESIINKAGSLDEEEWEKVKRHSEIGYRILSSVNEFSEIANHVLEHHERYDGTGYPKGLKGEEISQQARIITVVDAYDAMTCSRPYKKSLSNEDAMKEIIKHSGTQFDPVIAKIFVEKIASNDKHNKKFIPKE